MPTISTRLAWALEVEASDLVAAIEVDAQFRPIVETLQLCNIFGGTATITKLPLELIDLIEEYIAADRLEVIAQRQHEVKKLCFCAEGLCNAFDHLSDSEKLLRVNEALKKSGEDEVESMIEQWEIKSTLVPRLIERFALEERQDLLDRHAMNVEEWRQLVGRKGLVDCGLFSKHSEFVRRYYGLVVFVTHTGSNYRGRTLTYLNLPDGTRRYRATKVERFDETPEHQEVGFGIARAVSAPQDLTEGQEARFVRMLTGLAMPGWKLGASNQEQQLQRILATPELTMLTHVRMEQCSRLHQENVPWEELADLEVEGEEE
ncbi:hypothetical protein LTR56_015313 [Elasticomyces elasticus]|nr:hypothetical protein LTR56_015313 [Elasticomyces elasticus]KAK3640411.1 hypothetical protein LTR22_017068 [Elasticomyces elasticus]KAK4913661.1 hypothetical protein LTR49_018075 [Elasticomyces elasticus]KAK5753088.1 hypothetical protein LTS12_016868 [Elasticomyces elasticus]